MVEILFDYSIIAVDDSGRIPSARESIGTYWVLGESCFSSFLSGIRGIGGSLRFQCLDLFCGLLPQSAEWVSPGDWNRGKVLFHWKDE